MTNSRRILEDFAKSKKDFFFIQIGAYDGVTGDPIFKLSTKFKWKGILVEPQKDAFELLLNNYSGSNNLTFVNAAISNTNGPQKFYGVKPIGSDDFNHGQLHSFRMDVILKHTHMVEQLANRVVEYEVEGITFDTLLKKYNVNHLDLLQIDTEGFDYEVIKQIKFHKLKPKMINFEHKHLTVDDKEACYKLLRGQGYTLEIGRFNCLAY